MRTDLALSLAPAILEALDAGPLSGRAIALRCGSRWRAVFAELRELTASGLVVCEGKARRSRYRLTSGRIVARGPGIVAQPQDRAPAGSDA